MIDANSVQLVIFSNNTERPLILMKNQTVGKIEEYAGNKQAIFLTLEEASQVILSGVSFDSVDKYFNFIEKNIEQTEESKEPEIPSIDNSLLNYRILRISDILARKNK